MDGSSFAKGTAGVDVEWSQRGADLDASIGRIAPLRRSRLEGPECALLRSFRCEPATATHAAYDSRAPFRRPELIEENERPDHLAASYDFTLQPTPASENTPARRP